MPSRPITNADLRDSSLKCRLPSCPCQEHELCPWSKEYTEISIEDFIDSIRYPRDCGSWKAPNADVNLLHAPPRTINRGQGRIQDLFSANRRIICETLVSWHTPPLRKNASAPSTRTRPKSIPQFLVEGPYRDIVNKQDGLWASEKDLDNYELAQKTSHLSSEHPNASNSPVSENLKAEAADPSPSTSVGTGNGGKKAKKKNKKKKKNGVGQDTKTGASTSVNTPDPLLQPTRKTPFFEPSGSQTAIEYEYTAPDILQLYTEFSALSDRNKPYRLPMEPNNKVFPEFRMRLLEALHGLQGMFLWSNHVVLLQNVKHLRFQGKDWSGTGSGNPPVPMGDPEGPLTARVQEALQGGADTMRQAVKIVEGRLAKFGARHRYQSDSGDPKDESSTLENPDSPDKYSLYRVGSCDLVRSKGDPPPKVQYQTEKGLLSPVYHIAIAGSPPQRLSSRRSRPWFRLMVERSWLDKRRMLDAYILLLSAYRLRQDDLLRFGKESKLDPVLPNPSPVLWGTVNTVEGFGLFLYFSRLRGMTPAWWDQDHHDACLKFAFCRRDWDVWHWEEEKPDADKKPDVAKRAEAAKKREAAKEKYLEGRLERYLHNGPADPSLVLQLRVFAELVYGWGAGRENWACLGALETLEEAGLYKKHAEASAYFLTEYGFQDRDDRGKFHAALRYQEKMPMGF